MLSDTDAPAGLGERPKEEPGPGKEEAEEIAEPEPEPVKKPGPERAADPTMNLIDNPPPSKLKPAPEEWKHQTIEEVRKSQK